MSEVKRSFGAILPTWMQGKTVQEIDAIYEEARATGKTVEQVVAGEEWKKRLPLSN